MNGLADEVAAVLAEAPTGVSCDALARRLRRRRTDVLAALDEDPRFVRAGRTNGSRWRLATDADPGPAERDGRGRDRDGMGRNVPGEDGSRAAPNVAGPENGSYGLGWIRGLETDEWPPEADWWLARDGRWRSTASEPPHFAGEVVAVADGDEPDAAVAVGLGGLRDAEATVVEWAARAGEPLDPFSFDDAATTLRAAALVEGGETVADAVAVARREFEAAVGGRRAAS